jgi:hypothetical protein
MGKRHKKKAHKDLSDKDVTICNSFLKSNLPLIFLFSLVFLLFLFRIPLALKNPLFIGDSGHRMDHAEKIIIKTGNRFWLPVLQFHIWVFYKLKLPYYLYKLIPCFYYLIALFFLAKLSCKIIGNSFSSILFSSFLLLCFANHSQMIFHSINLYQEILAMALFYLLLNGDALFLKSRKYLLFFASIALLTRDTFFIYFFVITSLNLKKIIKSKSNILSIAWLWLIPISWFLAIPFTYLAEFSRWPRIPLEWPLMINKKSAISNIFNSMDSLLAALLKSKLNFIIVAFAAILALRLFYSIFAKKIDPNFSLFGNKFKLFSLLSIGIIYTLIILFNPWKCTFGNTRMVMPLFAHLFIWILILYRKSISYPNALKIITRILLISALLLSTSKNPIRGYFQEHTDLKRMYTAIHKIKTTYDKDYVPTVCIVGNYWKSVTYFIAPTLYMKRLFVRANDMHKTKQFDIGIIPSNTKFNKKGFANYGNYKVNGKSYTLYAKTKFP